MRQFIVFMMMVFFLLGTIQSYGAEKGSKKPGQKSSASREEKFPETTYHALIIGNNQYKYLPKLKTAQNDAVEVEKILKEKFKFTTELLLDATRTNILGKINEMRRRLGEKDNLLIYYAGHGEYDKTVDKSYWLPVDAQRDDPTNWIIADDITSNIKRIAARHVLIVSDSCFSGTLTRQAVTELISTGGREEYLKKMQARPSRTLMSSGGNEPVSDSGEGNNSVFAVAFLKSLKEAEKEAFTAEEIFHSRIKAIVAGKSDQVPEYSSIKNSGDEGGDFVFRLARMEVEPLNTKIDIKAQGTKEDKELEKERKTIEEERKRLEVEKAQLEKDRKRVEQEQKMEEERQQLAEEKKRIEEEKQVLAEKKAKKQAVYTDLAAFVPLKGDLSKYDPNNQDFFVNSGDTIKFAIWDPFTGANAYIGEAYYALLGFVAQDINSQGGIKVDGKMKKIQIIKIDTQSAPDPAKQALEKAILEEKILAFSGVAGNYLAKIGQNLAKEHKVIFVNLGAYSDELNMLPFFNEYYFRTCGSASSTAKALAVFYKNRPETKFYILGQDYNWGHESTTVFKKTIMETKANARIVGEEFFPLFTKEFAPYLERVRTSGAEVVVTMAWGADNENLIKQSRHMGLKSPLNPALFIPMASPFLDDSRPLEAIGGPAGRGLVLCTDFSLDRRIANVKKLIDIWNTLWKTTWKAPYNTPLYQWPYGGWHRNLVGYYWFFQALQKAGSTSPKKIIAAWEGDSFDFFGRKHYMRPDDHNPITDFPIAELEFPNMWERILHAAPGTPRWIPAKDCMPAFDEKLKGRTRK